MDNRLEGRKLTWNMRFLRDIDSQEGYDWSYGYTVIAWNDAALNVLVNHYDADDFCKAGTGGSDNLYFANNTSSDTALSSFTSFLQTPDVPLGATVAILPRGFAPRWDSDNNLLQLAYILDHIETFVEYGKKHKKPSGDVPATLPTSLANSNSGFVSWNTNAERRFYIFGEMVSALGGNDVGVLQPPFSVLLQGSGFNVCQGGLKGVKTEDFGIEKVPFEYTIPMLTGWHLNYPCDHGDVKEIGIWVVDEWRNDKRPAIPAGTLRYKLSSILCHKDGDRGPLRSHKVTILGLRPTVSVAEKQTAPDLVPFSSYGNYRSAFCRIEQGRKLRVTVKNQGNDKAPASKTTVTFRDKSFSLDTPAIPVGGSVDLLFDVPASCLRPFCSFKIMVDANSQVDELNMEGNNSASGGCIG
ncbi:MAG: hypothetical protein M3461_23290 [Pseudomonadota bacterium]|nr:hypothetical protein [Pseudomonadota bacterium]